MRSITILTMVLTAGVLISLGVKSLFDDDSVQGATNISQTKYETVKIFTKAELNEATGLTLEANSVAKVYEALKQPAIWKKWNYSLEEAKRIVARFTQSKQQALAILSKMANVQTAQLKVVVVNKPKAQKINIGTYSAKSAETDESKQTSNSTTSKLAAVKELEVEIEANHQTVAFDYEIKANHKVTAQYDDQFAKEKLTGTAAQAKIEAIMSGLDLKQRNDKTIKDHLLKRMNLATDIEKFEFKAELTDQTTIEFNED